MRSYNGMAGPRRLRLHRLYRHHPGRMLIVALDHPLTGGPAGRRRADFNRLVGQLATNGADSVILHEDGVRQVDPVWFAQMALIVALRPGPGRADQAGPRLDVASVEEALQLGADAVSVQVDLGSGQEVEQLADLAVAAEACDRWNVPLVAMMYLRGSLAGPRAPAFISHAVAIAVELGADVVKTGSAVSTAQMLRLTAWCPVPIVAEGTATTAPEPLAPADHCGAGWQEPLARYVGAALDGGAAGVAVGRAILESAEPAETTRRLARVVHDGLPGCVPFELAARSADAF